MRHLSFQPAAQLGSVCSRFSAPHIGRWNSGAGSAPSCVRSPADRRDVPSANAVETDPLTRLEAVLFLSKEPLTSRKLAQFAGLEDGTQARTLIQSLNRAYDQCGRAFRVEEVAGGYQLLTRRKFSGWLRRLSHVPGEARVSQPALETLAVIAYRQPVLKADIEAIRGVHCGELLRQLMERDLVRISGRSEELGRPFFYSTTRRFLNLFGLHSLEDLPRADRFRSLPVIPGPPLAQLMETDEESSPSGQEAPYEYTVEDDEAAEGEH